MERITFECQVITPMFLAGADGQTPELRPPSIKGAMRFWWRAVNGHLPLADLKRLEADIFGSQDKRSKVEVEVEWDEQNVHTDIKPLNGKTYEVKGRDLDILFYLTYGVSNYNKQNKRFVFLREYFVPERTNFIVKILYPDCWKEEFINENIILPFYLISVIGGLGAKARNGFGRFKITNLEQNFDLQEIIEKYRTKNYPLYTAFSQHSELIKLPQTYNNWEEALSNLGLKYREARLDLDEPHDYKNRKYIASPLLVYDRYERKTVDYSIYKGLRHSKSLFFYVEKTDKHKYSAGFLVIPYKFLNTKPNSSYHFDEYKKVYDELKRKLK